MPLLGHSDNSRETVSPSLTHVARAYDKMIMDFRKSVVKSPLAMLEAHTKTVTHLTPLLTPTKAARLFNLPPRSLGHRVWVGIAPPQSVNSLREMSQYLGRPIRVNCLGTLVAAHLVLNEMNSLIALDMSGPKQLSSHEQILDSESRNEPYYDIMIAADAAPFFSTSPVVDAYTMYCEIHNGGQSVLRRRGSPQVSRPKLYVYEKSSVELQLHVAKQTAQRHGKSRYPLLTTIRSHDIREFGFLADFRHILATMHPGDLLIAWEPYATNICRNRDLERVKGHDFDYTNSIYFNADWRSHPDAMFAFASLFVAEWNRLGVNHQVEWQRFLHNGEFWDAFDLTDKMTSEVSRALEHVVTTSAGEASQDGPKELGPIGRITTDSASTRNTTTARFDRATNVFRRPGGGNQWEIAFAGNNGSFSDSKGFEYVHALLSRPNEFIAATELEKLSPVVSSAYHETLSERDAHRLKSERVSLQAELDSLPSEDSDQTQDEADRHNQLKADIIALDKYLKTYSRNGIPDQQADDSARRVVGNIDRVLKILKLNGMEQLANHLQGCRKRWNRSFRYAPSEAPPKWVLEPHALPSRTTNSPRTE